MKRIFILVALSFFLCLTASAFQGGGGESTRKRSSKKKEATKKKSSGATSANTTPPRPPAAPGVSLKKAPPQPSTSVSRESNGVITGAISYSGPPPELRPIDTSAEPACNPSGLLVEDLIVTNGRLANVFVYVKSGTNLNGVAYRPATPVILDQSQCRFMPHVFGLATNQTLQIRNSDQAIYNVHPTPRKNPEWNMTQRAGAEPLITQFTYPEVMIPIKDNIHPWMRAYVGVLPHPFFAVSREDGSFRIERLPAGRYTIAAWHERLGEQILYDVAISSGEVKVLTFSFAQR